MQKLNISITYKYLFFTFISWKNINWLVEITEIASSFWGIGEILELQTQQRQNLRRGHFYDFEVILLLTFYHYLFVLWNGSRIESWSLAMAFYLLMVPQCEATKSSGPSVPCRWGVAGQTLGGPRSCHTARHGKGTKFGRQVMTPTTRALHLLKS